MHRSWVGAPRQPGSGGGAKGRVEWYCVDASATAQGGRAWLTAAPSGPGLQLKVSGADLTRAATSQQSTGADQARISSAAP